MWPVVKSVEAIVVVISCRINVVCVVKNGSSRFYKMDKRAPVNE